MAAFWLDDAIPVFDARARAYRLYQRRRDRRGAGRVAMTLADDYLSFRGEVAVARGWLQRANRLLGGLAPIPEQGWLKLWEGYFGAARDLAAAIPLLLGSRASLEVIMKRLEIPVVAIGLALNAAIALAQAPGEAPKPTPEHKKLGYYVGKWTVEGEMKPSPFTPGGKFTNSDSCEWFEGGFSVVCRSEGKGPMGPTKGLGIMSYNIEEKAYTYYGVDNSPMAMASVPRGTVQGDSWVYNDEAKMGGKTVKSRYTIKQGSPTSYTFKWEMVGDDGAWKPIMEGKATKAP